MLPCVQISFNLSTLIIFFCLVSYRSVLQKVLDQKPTFRSLKQDVLPYLVRTQLVSWIMSMQSKINVDYTICLVTILMFFLC